MINGVILQKLQTLEEEITQFRNFIVHRYEHVDAAILAGIMQDHLSDFERFRNEILAYTEAEDDRDE